MYNHIYEKDFRERSYKNSIESTVVNKYVVLAYNSFPVEIVEFVFVWPCGESLMVTHSVVLETLGQIYLQAP